jgi:hypothetical protein
MRGYYQTKSRKMTVKNRIKLSILGVAVVLIGILTCELLFGQLFPFSPLIIGFTKHDLSNSIIYVQRGADYTDYQRLDTLIPAVEKFHEKTFVKKPEMFIFKDSLKFIHRSFSKARFSAYPSGRLLVSPWALREDRAGMISLEIYVRHELSHVLLMQYMSYSEACHYPQWLMEGIAVYCANQMGTSFYPGKEETYHSIAEGNFLPPLDFKTGKGNKVKLNVQYPIAFEYSEFACIVDYLIATYGKEKLLTYVKELIGNRHSDKAFKVVYNLEFSDAIRNFKKHVSGKN